MYAECAEEKPYWCLGCGAAINAGDGYMPFDDHWLLCLDCAEHQPDSGRPASPWSVAVHV